MSTSKSPMIQDLKLMYKAELLEISQHLTKEQFKMLLFYCKDFVPESYSSSFSIPDEIFGCLEENELISYEKLSFLKKFADAIGQKVLVAKLTKFEITRELILYALNRQGLKTSMNSSTTSLGHHLAQMADEVQDQIDPLPVQGMIKFLPGPVQNFSDILDEMIEALLGSDSSKSWNGLALRVAAAADIVRLVVRAKQQQENCMENALQVAKELANDFWSDMEKLGTWEELCQFVKERHDGHFCTPVPEPPSDFPRQFMLSLIGKMKDTFFAEKLG